MIVQQTSPDRLIEDFLGSVQIFASAINELLEARLREATGSAITFSQIKLLNLVAQTEGHTISDVAAFLGVSNAAASKAVDRLVRRGLMKREEAEADRRAVELSLTNEGKSVLATYHAITQRALQDLFGGLSEKELQETSRLLDRLSVNIVNLEEGLDEICFRCGIHFRDRCLIRAARKHDCYFHKHRKEKSARSLPTL